MTVSSAGQRGGGGGGSFVVKRKGFGAIKSSGVEWSW